jgi:hypothetical protein
VSKISTFFWLQTKIPKINTGNQNHIFQVEKMQKFTPKTTWVGEEKGTSSMIIHPSQKKKKNGIKSGMQKIRFDIFLHKFSFLDFFFLKI